MALSSPTMATIDPFFDSRVLAKRSDGGEKNDTIEESNGVE
jgi:hypothetical protein